MNSPRILCSKFLRFSSFDDLLHIRENMTAIKGCAGGKNDGLPLPEIFRILLSQAFLNMPAFHPASFPFSGVFSFSGTRVRIYAANSRKAPRLNVQFLWKIPPAKMPIT